jgi:hypothetical protein
MNVLALVGAVLLAIVAVVAFTRGQATRKHDEGRLVAYGIAALAGALAVVLLYFAFLNDEDVGSAEALLVLGALTIPPVIEDQLDNAKAWISGALGFVLIGVVQAVTANGVSWETIVAGATGGLAIALGTKKTSNDVGLERKLQRKNGPTVDELRSSPDPDAPQRVDDMRSTPRRAPRRR